MNEDSIFALALEKTSAADRQTYLDQACAGNAALRAQVEELLQASSDAGSFLNHAPVGLDATIPATHADGDTEKSAVWTGSLPFLEPCDKPDRIGKLAHYEIIEMVGHGGMGAVLRAFDTKLSRVVAVKVMAPELAANPTAVKRFLREAQSAASVHHDHVVTIHAVEDAHHPPYLVMQFIEGQTLAQKIEREGALELRHILRIGNQMAAGLAAAHKHGLIHRDVKPANILLENGVERVKITDFGLARAADDLEMTQTGVIAGTPQYMSPEQAKGEQIDVRSDLFSLGSVLYSMCTGRPAFRAETTMGILRRVCDDVPRPIAEVNPEIPPWLQAIVGKLLAKHPADRFQTAGEVAELLSQHLAHVQNPAQVPRPATIVTAPGAALVQPAKEAKPGEGLTAHQQHQRSLGIATLIWLLMAAVFLALTPIGLIGIGLLVPYFAAQSSPRKNTLYPGPIVPAASLVQPVAVVPAAAPVDLVQWGKFLDPSGNCRIERQPHLAIFHVPGDVPYNLDPSTGLAQNAPRLLRDAEGDFVLQVRMLPFSKSQAGTSTSGPSTSSWRSAGLVLVVDEQTLVRLERVSWGERKGGAPMLHLECFKQGRRVTDFYGVITDDDRSTLLQIERRGSNLHCRYSDDGSRWEEHPIEDLALPERVLVGLVAVHTTPTQFDPAFEDLRFQDATGSIAKFPDEPGWTPLWNGQDLTGWKPHPEAPGRWTVQGDVLVGCGANQYLYTQRGDYADFRLRAEVKINSKGDSGILVRMTPPGSPPVAESGYEVQLVGDPAHVSPTATIIRHGTSVKGRGVMGRGDLIRPGEWFVLEIAAVGGKLSVSIDGREVVSYRDDPPRESGHIALQSFSDSTEVSFRKIQIRELAAAPEVAAADSSGPALAAAAPTASGVATQAAAPAAPQQPAAKEDAWLTAGLPPLVDPAKPPPFEIKGMEIKRNHVEQELLQAEYRREWLIRTLADEVKLVILPSRGGRYAVFAAESITISPRESGSIRDITGHLLDYQGELPGGARVYLEMRVASPIKKHDPVRISKVFWFGTAEQLAAAKKAGQPPAVDLKASTAPAMSTLAADHKLPAGTPLWLRVGSRWQPATLWQSVEAGADLPLLVFLARPGGLYLPWQALAKRENVQIETAALDATRTKPEQFATRLAEFKQRLATLDAPRKLVPVGETPLAADSRLLMLGDAGLTPLTALGPAKDGIVRVQDSWLRREVDRPVEQLYLDPDPPPAKKDADKPAAEKPAAAPPAAEAKPPAIAGEAAKALQPVAAGETPKVGERLRAEWSGKWWEVEVFEVVDKDRVKVR